ncbi:MAG: helix-turn-helix transcriptional regulator [Rhodospirillaceae bacterium]|nr:MAG: helix-turn-helix transcriptional regulator [Rhodospirillaceae bacterium]
MAAILNEAALDPFRVTELAHIRPAAEALRDAVLDLCGLRTAICHNIAVQEPMRDADGAVLASEVFGFTDAEARWWQFPQLALSSPLASACRVESEPFWCNAGGFHPRTANPLLAALDLAHFRERALTSAAIVVPIHLPFGQIAASSFLSPDPAVEDLSAPFAAHGETLALCARTFIQGYVKVTERRRSTLPGAALSKREVECLRWAAAGKTNDEIGVILSLQRTTVRFHIRAASRKLNAVNRDQTLFKAAQLGFLGMMR